MSLNTEIPVLEVCALLLPLRTCHPNFKQFYKNDKNRQNTDYRKTWTYVANVLPQQVVYHLKMAAFSSLNAKNIKTKSLNLKKKYLCCLKKKFLVANSVAK